MQHQANYKEKKQQKQGVAGPTKSFTKHICLEMSFCEWANLRLNRSNAMLGVATLMLATSALWVGLGFSKIKMRLRQCSLPKKK
ncbi:MAG: hypothetical protein EAZ80_04405 [Runella slithyformis]|nr:MAG: hypothetical protein EAZ80_04405 [Runella slithyformis]